jgi:hypothetical protein
VVSVSCKEEAELNGDYLLLIILSFCRWSAWSAPVGEGGDNALYWVL